jgi:DNA polymerase eta
MGASKNLQHPIKHPSEGPHWLRILAGELAFRLLEAREDNPGLWPKRLVLHVRQCTSVLIVHGCICTQQSYAKLAYDTSRSKQAPFPFTRTVTTDFICKVAEKLWTELVGTSAEYDKNKAKGTVTGMKITNVFLAFTGVEVVSIGQQTIEGFFPGADGAGKRKAEDGSPARKEGAKKRKGNGYGDDNDALDLDDLSFRCSRCGKQVRRDADGMIDREEALGVLKMEHEDFHFAQDLAREGEGSGGGTHSSTNTQKKKKKKAEPKGIAKFFTPTNSKK